MANTNDSEAVEAIDARRADVGVVLDGWKAIAAHLQQVFGVARDVRTLRRWARRKTDPLPVYHDPGHRSVLASGHQLERWYAAYCK